MRAWNRLRVAGGVAALALVVGACGSGTDSADKSEVIKAHIEPTVEAIVPTNSVDESSLGVVNAIYTGLVKFYGKNPTAQNAVAESITPDAAYKLYTITLKKGWKFHNGTEVKAHNFVNAWNYGAAAVNKQRNSSMYASIAGYSDVTEEDKNGNGKIDDNEKAKSTTMPGLKIVDDYTFTVELTQPIRSFVQSLAFSAFFPLPDSFLNDPKPIENPIGNGPYKLVKWKKNEDMELEKFADYPGLRNDELKKIIFKFYPPGADDAAYNELRDNKIDIVDVIPSNKLQNDAYKNELAGRTVLYDQPVVATIGMPMYLPEYKNPDLAKAISMAIDRETLNKSLYNGNRPPASGWVPPGVQGYAPNACGEFCTFNPEKAKQHLAASGFKGNLSFSYTTSGPNQPLIQAVCNMIKQNLQVDCKENSLGVQDNFMQALETKKVKSIFQSGFGTDYPSIEAMLIPLYSTNGYANSFEYSNPQFDELIKKGNAAPTVEESMKFFQEAERLLANDMPAIPLYSYVVAAGHSNKVSNLTFTTQGDVDWQALQLN